VGASAVVATPPSAKYIHDFNTPSIALPNLAVMMLEVARDHHNIAQNITNNKLSYTWFVEENIE
jgi:hypothetical protein